MQHARRVSTRAAAIGLWLLAEACSGGGTHSGGGPSPDAYTPDVAVGGAGTSTSTATATSTPGPQYFGILDGVPMSAAEWEASRTRLPVAVMIDNSIDAFPQAGLEQADLVYEAFVEGGATRFMAVYWRREAANVEPVRSARTPFVIWASELDALYAHGGSAETYNEANAGGQLFDWKVRDLEAFADRGSTAYFRDPDRRAPHDLATSTQKLREAAAKLALADPLYRVPEKPYDSWRFKQDRTEIEGFPLAGAVEVDWNAQRFAVGTVQWWYDRATNSYLRFQFGAAHIDASSKKQLAFTNVVVMHAPYRVVDDAGHVVYDLIGSGPAKIFLDGREIDGTWKKTGRTARTRFFTNAGDEVAFNRGSTWVEVVGPQTKVQSAATPEQLPKLPAPAR